MLVLVLCGKAAILAGNRVSRPIDSLPTGNLQCGKCSREWAGSTAKTGIQYAFTSRAIQRRCTRDDAIMFKRKLLPRKQFSTRFCSSSNGNTPVPWRKPTQPQGSALRVQYIGVLGAVVLATTAVVLTSPRHDVVQLLPEPARAFLGRLVRGGTARVVQASAAAACKLALVCGFITWMMQSERLPRDTPVILSKVAFQLILPAFLCSKVANTLASSTANIKLAAIPIMAIVQVVVGGVLGAICAFFVCRDRAMASAIEGWHPTRPAPSAEAVAAATAAAVGVQAEGFSEAMLPEIDTKAKEPLKRVVALACAFGNSLTMPLVFLMEILTPMQLERAAGYIALFLVGWSPSLWSIGYQMINFNSGTDESRKLPLPSLWTQIKTWSLRLINPPLCGVFLGVLIGTTPLAKYILPAAVSDGNLALSKLSMELAALAAIGRSAMACAELLGSAALPVQTIVLASSLAGPGKAPSFDEEMPLRLVRNDLAGSTILMGVSLVRLVLLPATMFAIILWLQSLHLLPMDPVCTLMLLMQSAMPSAQNLVLLLQLQPATRLLAGKTATMLLRQYFISIVTITIWASVFAGILL